MANTSEGTWVWRLWAPTSKTRSPVAKISTPRGLGVTEQLADKAALAMVSHQDGQTQLVIGVAKLDDPLGDRRHRIRNRLGGVNLDALAQWGRIGVGLGIIGGHRTDCLGSKGTLLPAIPEVFTHCSSVLAAAMIGPVLRPAWSKVIRR
jgi:hypothetical protein